MVSESTTSTTSNPNSVIVHSAAHGLGHISPELVIIGVAVVALMAFAEWRRQSRRATRP